MVVQQMQGCCTASVGLFLGSVFFPGYAGGQGYVGGRSSARCLSVQHPLLQVLPLVASISHFRLLLMCPSCCPLLSTVQFSSALRELQKTAQYGSTVSQAEFS